MYVNMENIYIIRLAEIIYFNPKNLEATQGIVN